MLVLRGHEQTALQKYVGVRGAERISLSKESKESLRLIFLALGRR